MNKLIFLALSFALVMPALAADFPKGSPKFEHSYRGALSDAKKSGKPVVLIFSAAWCPPCQSMKKDVYPSAEVKEFHDKFVWAYLDVDDNSTGAAAKKFKVQGIPHIEFLNSAGESLDQQVGGNDAASFAKRLAGVLAKAAK